jgi:hypothetical protein
MLALWWLIDRGSKLWLDEAEAAHASDFVLTEEARTVDARASSAPQAKGEMMMARETITIA